MKNNMTINGQTVENPIVVWVVILSALMAIGALVAFVLFVILPLIGVVIATLLVVAASILIPVIIWFATPFIVLAFSQKVIAVYRSLLR